MHLFDEFQRDYPGPRKHAQPSYEFLNISARPDAVELRSLLEQWVARFPTDGRADLVARFQSSDDAQHYGALLEMYCSELLLAHGFRVELHPTTRSAKPTHPDFLVRKDEEPLCFFECTLAADPMSEPAKEARKNAVKDALDRLDPGPYIVTLEFGAIGNTSPSGSKLRREVEAWLHSLEDAETPESEPGSERRASHTWTPDGWEITFHAHRNAWAETPPRRRGIAGHMEGMRYVDSSGRLRRSLSQKAKRYGKDLGLPYVVAVNSLEDILEDYDVMEALFGEMRYTTNIHTGDTREERAPNGLWRGSNGLQYGRMSGILVIENLVPWTVWSAPAKLWHHPDETYPLDPGVWKTTQILYDKKQSKMVERQGEPAAALIGLERP